MNNKSGRLLNGAAPVVFRCQAYYPFGYFAGALPIAFGAYIQLLGKKGCLPR